MDPVGAIVALAATVDKAVIVGPGAATGAGGTTREGAGEGRGSEAQAEGGAGVERGS